MLSESKFAHIWVKNFQQLINGEGDMKSAHLILSSSPLKVLSSGLKDADLKYPRIWKTRTEELTIPGWLITMEYASNTGKNILRINHISIFPNLSLLKWLKSSFYMLTAIFCSLLINKNQVISNIFENIYVMKNKV